ncbi:AAA family ATPase, partial [Candidatus Bipolaricaulota bacterium]|nr:AAA family ATPase [Candidatus Bipolaricaulota bacterium]
LRERLRAGELEDQWVEIPVKESVIPQINVFSEAGMDQLGIDLSQLFAGFPTPRRPKRMTVAKAREVLREEALERLLNMEEVRAEGVRLAEESGIVFIDELDKLALGGAEERGGPGVSRQGVQRDLLPLLEGTTVRTRYGTVRTDNILFIAAGAFSQARPSDLMPELQGRLPIRVELHPLTEEHFRRILVEPEDALTKQYQALLSTEGVEVEFTDEAIAEIARVAAELNRALEDIGARRLITVMERVMEELSFSADLHRGERFVIDREYVRERVSGLAADLELSRYIL